MNDSMRDPKTSGRIPTAITVFTVIAALGLAFFGVKALTAPAEGLPAGTTIAIYAQYMAARNIPLVIALIAAMFVRDRTVLATLLGLGGLIQLSDAMIGISNGSAALIISPLILATLYLLSARYWFTHRGAGPVRP